LNLDALKRNAAYAVPLGASGTDLFPLDTDNDGIENMPDLDDDGDTVPDEFDRCPVTRGVRRPDTTGSCDSPSSRWVLIDRGRKPVTHHRPEMAQD
jgi:hypothetical protein